MSQDPPPLVIEPAIVMVRPRYSNLVTAIFGAIVAYRKCAGDPPCRRLQTKAFWGSLLSLAIVWIDRRLDRSGRSVRGEFSHAGVTLKGWMRDAVSRQPLVQEYWLEDLHARYSRDFVAFQYPSDNGRLAAVYASHEAPRLPDPPDFSTEGLMRLALILLTTTSRLGSHAIGRWLVSWASSDDPKGFFCTEFVANSFVDSETPLEVIVHPGRVAPFQAAPRTTWRKVVEDRVRIRNGSVNPAEIEEAMGQLEEFSTWLQGQELPRRVNVGRNRGEMPPYLVTPNDLATSPSLSRGLEYPRPRATK